MSSSERDAVSWRALRRFTVAVTYCLEWCWFALFCGSHKKRPLTLCIHRDIGGPGFPPFLGICLLSWRPSLSRLRIGLRVPLDIVVLEFTGLSARHWVVWIAEWPNLRRLNPCSSVCWSVGCRRGLRGVPMSVVGFLWEYPEFTVCWALLSIGHVNISHRDSRHIVGVAGALLLIQLLKIVRLLSRLGC